MFHNYKYMKVPNFTFFKDGKTRQQLSYSFPELWYSHLEFNSKKFANIWRIKQDGISAAVDVAIDVAVAVAVAVVDA